MFLSLYRSGSFVFFVADFIRKFISFEDRHEVDIFAKKFSFDIHGKLQGESQGNVNQERFHSLYSCMWDDFFVPKLGLYTIKGLHDYFNYYGFAPLKYCDRDFREYNHIDSGIAFQSPLLYLERTREADIKNIAPTAFPLHIDQMYDIIYNENYINHTIKLMEAFLEKAKKLTQEIKIDAALKMYSIAHKEYGKKDNEASQRHMDIQAVLKKAL